MSDRRRPTDGELFRRFRPGVGRPAAAKPPGKPWRPPGLKGDRAVVCSLATSRLNDAEALEFVRETARWLNKPHGLTRPASDRPATDRALRKLLYGTSDGEAEFLRRRLLARPVGARPVSRKTTGGPGSPVRSTLGVEPYADGTPTRPSSGRKAPSPTPRDPGSGRDGTAATRFAEFLASSVPRREATEIVRLVARDCGTDLPGGLATDFARVTAQFVNGHLEEARAEELLRALQKRAAAGEPWIRPDRRGRAHARRRRLTSQRRSGPGRACR
jgi:hypothetical protein